MKLSEMISQAIAELRDDGVSEPTNTDIRQMIYAIYSIHVEVEDLAKVRLPRHGFRTPPNFIEKDTEW